MSLTSTIFIIMMPKATSGTGKEAKEAEDAMKQSSLFKWLYLLPIPMFGASFLLNVMCFRRESLGYYIHKKDKENSMRALR